MSSEVLSTEEVMENDVFTARTESLYSVSGEQIVVFRLAEESYGITIAEVWEILETGPITNIPNSPDFISGLFNFRGTLVTVIDLRLLFNIVDGEVNAAHIMIIRDGENVYGLLVDEVTDVLKFSNENIKDPPSLITERIGIDIIKGICSIEDKLVILLRIQNLIKNLVQRDYSKLKIKGERETEDEE